MEIASYIRWLRRVGEKAPCHLARLTEAAPMSVTMPPGDFRPMDLRNDPQQVKTDEANMTSRRTPNTLFVVPVRLAERELSLVETLEELRLIKIQRTPLRGTFESVSPDHGNSEFPRIIGLTAKGSEFLALASDVARLSKAVSRATKANALTFNIVLRELRMIAASDINTARKETI